MLDEYKTRNMLCCECLDPVPDRKEELIKVARRRFAAEGLGYDALLSRHGGVAECGWNLPVTREVCSRDPKEVQDDGLQGHDHTCGIELEYTKCFFIKVG